MRSNFPWNEYQYFLHSTVLIITCWTKKISNNFGFIETLSTKNYVSNSVGFNMLFIQNTKIVLYISYLHFLNALVILKLTIVNDRRIITFDLWKQMTYLGQKCILDLPDKVIEEIMAYLPLPELFNLGKAIERVPCAERVSRSREFRKYIILKNIQSYVTFFITIRVLNHSIYH